jgi:protein-S-isoprenylcysteine O-methyltransferase Ste14
MYPGAMTFELTPEKVTWAVWLIWWGSWMAAALWSDRSVNRPAAQHQILYRVLAGIGAILLFGMYRMSPATELRVWRTPDGIAWAMVAVVLAGLLFTWWARIHLGRLWSSNVSRKADHHVVDSGPYGIVRHPIYTGIILATAATAVIRGTAASWLGFAVMTLGWYIKARMEEAFLRDQLGAEQYGAYARRIPMLVPFTGK